MKPLSNTANTSRSFEEYLSVSLSHASSLSQLIVYLRGQSMALYIPAGSHSFRKCLYQWTMMLKPILPEAFRRDVWMTTNNINQFNHIARSPLLSKRNPTEYLESIRLPNDNACHD